MAVSVTTERGMNQDVVKTFEKGRAVYVSDGHLFVGSDPASQHHSRVIAVFAPGKWVDVEVQPAE